MTINYTTLLGLAKPVTGTETGQWGDVVNDSITSLLEDAVANAATFSVTSGNVTLTTTNGSSNQARMSTLIITGSPGTTRNVIAPSQAKVYVVINQSDGAVVIKGAATTGVTVGAGQTAQIAWNGSDFVEVGNYVHGNFVVNGNLTVNGNSTLGDAGADTTTINGQFIAANSAISKATTLTTSVPALTWIKGQTYTDTGTAGGTTQAHAPFNLISAPTLSTSNIVTYTNASTLYVAGAPTAGTNVTITNPYSLYVAGGAAYFGGAVTYAGGINFNGNVTVGDSSTDTLTINSTITSTLLFTDNTYDIGASGATRPRNLYLAGSITAAGNTILGAGTSQTTTVNGVLNIASGSSYPVNASVTGGVSAYLYSDGGGSGIASNNPYTSGSLVYLTSTGINQYVGSTSMTTLNTTGLSIGLGTTGPLSRLDVALTTPNFDSVGNVFLRSTDALTSNIGAQLTMGGRYTSTAYYAFGGIAARKENSTSGNVAGSLYLMTTTSGGSLRPVMQFNSSGNAILGIWSNAPLNGGGAASWLTFDATPANTYSGGAIFAIGGVSQGSIYAESSYLKVQSSSGVGIKLIVNSSDQLTILSSGQAAINTTPRTNVALTTAAGWSGPGGWYIAHSAEATLYPMVRWLATSVDKASAIGNNGDGSLYFSVGGSSGSIGLTPLTIAATGISSFSYQARFDASSGAAAFGGSGYTLNPSYMLAGLYTSTRGYIQAPANGAVEIWDDGTNTIAQFLDNRTVQFAYGISVGNVAPSTSGAGITFPAAQSASSDANTLDDYEEGSFAGSVGIRGSGTAGSYSATINQAVYTKIGRLVSINMQISAITGSGGSGYLQITGMPFSNSYQAVGSIEFNYITINASTVQVVPEFISSSGQTIIYLREAFSSGNGQDFPISNISSGNANFNIQMTYQTST